MASVSRGGATAIAAARDRRRRARHIGAGHRADGRIAVTLIFVFIALVFFYSLVSARLESTMVTAPMVFTAAGIGMFFILSGVPAWKGDREFFLGLAEAGLVLLLFTDASRTDLHVLKSTRSLAARLLTPGCYRRSSLAPWLRWWCFASSRSGKRASSLPSSRRRMPAWDRSSSTARACRCKSAKP